MAAADCDPHSAVGRAGLGGDAPPTLASVLVWLRQDLRLHDNPALHAAAQDAAGAGGSVVVAYVHSPQEDGCELGQGADLPPTMNTSTCNHPWQQNSVMLASWVV